MRSPAPIDALDPSVARFQEFDLSLGGAGPLQRDAELTAAAVVHIVRGDDVLPGIGKANVGESETKRPTAVVTVETRGVLTHKVPVGILDFGREVKAAASRPAIAAVVTAPRHEHNDAVTGIAVE